MYYPMRRGKKRFKHWSTCIWSADIICHSHPPPLDVSIKTINKSINNITAYIMWIKLNQINANVIYRQDIVSKWYGLVGWLGRIGCSWLVLSLGLQVSGRVNRTPSKGPSLVGRKLKANGPIRPMKSKPNIAPRPNKTAVDLFTWIFHSAHPTCLADFEAHKNTLGKISKSKHPTRVNILWGRLS